MKTGIRIQNISGKLRERSSLREAREFRLEQNSLDEYGIPRVRLCTI